MLHPQAQALLRLIEEKGVPPTHTLAPAQARAAYLERKALTQPPPPEVGAVRNLVLAKVCATAGCSTPVRCSSTQWQAAASRARTRLPSADAPRKITSLKSTTTCHKIQHPSLCPGFAVQL